MWRIKICVTLYDVVTYFIV